MKVPAEVLKKVQLLELRTRKLVNNLFAGEYHTHFKGQGMTFKDFREYVPGDDVRSISWPLTARTGKTFVKQYEEERELTLILAVDISGSNDFGTGERFKGEVINWLAALLAFAAVKNNDQVGLLLFSDQVEHFVPPRKGRGQVQRILRDLYYFQPKSARTRISSALQHLSGILKKRTSVFVFSDFFDDNFEKSLRLLGSKHEVVACVISDPAEEKLPDLGVVDLQDAETGEILTVDTSSPFVRRQYEMEIKARREKRDRLLRKSQAERIDINTGGDITAPLIEFFRRRGR
ncbi:MAG: DUF58 domain-containing protein [Bdellovibrionaceae bacterium]|nr:DUF58 domain-containing protein [Pseudobdellovibrionaceae bacterium]